MKEYISGLISLENKELPEHFHGNKEALRKGLAAVLMFSFSLGVGGGISKAKAAEVNAPFAKLQEQVQVQDGNLASQQAKLRGKLVVDKVVSGEYMKDDIDEVTKRYVLGASLSAEEYTAKLKDMIPKMKDINEIDEKGRTV